MKLASYFISNGRSDSMKTELLFRIASAKTAGLEVIRFDIAGSEDEREQIFFRSKKILKSAKTDGTIRAFAYPSDFEKETTEGMYLLNLYPEISDLIAKAEYPFFYIKL